MQFIDREFGVFLHEAGCSVDPFMQFIVPFMRSIAVTTYQQANLCHRVWSLQEHSVRDKNEVQGNQGGEEDSL